MKLAKMMRFWSLGLAAAGVALVSGCGGGSKTNVVTVSVVPNGSSDVIVGTSLTLNATVSGATNLNVKWTCTFTTTTTTGTGSSTTTTTSAAKTTAKATKPAKVKREKIRFGQAPRNALPAGPEETSSGSDVGAGAASATAPAGAAMASSAAPGTAIAPVEGVTSSSSTTEPNPLEAQAPVQDVGPTWLKAPGFT